MLINPFSALSLYLDLTNGHSTKERRKVARTAAVAVFAVIAVFALIGGTLLKRFGHQRRFVSGRRRNFGAADRHFDDERQRQSRQAESRRAAGNGAGAPRPQCRSDCRRAHRHTDHHRPGRYFDRDYLRFGSQNVQRHRADYRGWFGGQCDLLCHFNCCRKVSRLLGATGLTILNRIMGMMLAAVSVEIIVSGLKTIFPQLAG